MHKPYCKNIFDFKKSPECRAEGPNTLTHRLQRNQWSVVYQGLRLKRGKLTY